MVVRTKKYNEDTISLIVKKAIVGGWNIGGLLDTPPTDGVIDAAVSYLREIPLFYFDTEFGKAYWGNRHYLGKNGNGGKTCPKCKVSFYGGQEGDNTECPYWKEKMKGLLFEKDRIKFLSRFL
jgi:hypothetical protein